MPAPKAIPPEERAVVELVLGQGRSYEEIARILDIPVDRVRAVGRRALDDMRELAEGQQQEESAPSQGQDEEDSMVPETLIFALYLVLILAGLVFFTVIGLAHR